MTPAERGEELAAIQAKLKREAAVRRAAAQGGAAKGSGARPVASGRPRSGR